MQRMQHSFIKNVKKCKESNILFIKNAKECENARSFERNGCPTLLPAPCSDLWSEGQFENDCQPPVQIFDIKVFENDCQPPVQFFEVEVSLRMIVSPLFRSLRWRSVWELLSAPSSGLWGEGQFENNCQPPVYCRSLRWRSVWEWLSAPCSDLWG